MSDLVECLIFIGLALMLAYTAFITVRFFRRYFLARRESSSLVPDIAPASRSRTNFVAELSRGLGTIRSIAAGAPFLGLAGTCYGMLEGFYRLGYQKYGGVGSIAAGIGVALVATASGLIVAIPAAISYNVLRSRLEKFESECSSTLFEATPRSYGFAQTLPLRGRFSRLPAFALIGAPVLALLIPMFALMLQRPIPVGLSVHLLKVGVTNHDSTSIVVSVIGSSARGESAAYVNSKEIPWNELGNTLRSQLRVRPLWSVYVAGEDKVAWRDVANAIDVARGLDAEVVLQTAPPEIDSSHSPKAKAKKKKAR